MNAIATLEVTPVQTKTINLSYLRGITKCNRQVIEKMLTIYLIQTPQLIQDLRRGFTEQNCKMLFEASHQLIPSFAIMGINNEFEAISRHIQTTAYAGHNNPELHELIVQLENVCSNACREIEIELKSIQS